MSNNSKNEGGWEQVHGDLGDEQTFQLGTRDEGTMVEPSTLLWGWSGSKAEAGRDHERLGQEEVV